MNFGQDCNFGEDMDTATASSEADEKKSTGMLASPLLMQKRSKRSPCNDFFTLPEKIQRQSHSFHIPSAGRLGAAHSRKRKSSRDTRSVQETHLTGEKIRSEQQEVRIFLKFFTDEAVEGEQEALTKLSEAEHTGLLLEEQRNQIFFETNLTDICRSQWRNLQIVSSASEQTFSLSSPGHLPCKSGL